MREDSFFANLVCEMSPIELKLFRFAFVDDTDLCLTQDPEKAKDIPNRMQNAVDHWAEMLRASGGALVPEKCYWYADNF